MEKQRLIISDIDGTIISHGSGVSPENVEMIKKAQKKNIALILATANSYTPEMMKLAKDLGAVFFIERNGVSIVKVNDGSLIVTNEENKGDAAKKLLDLLKVDVEDIMTIGDGYNDFELLNLSPNSYAMANANDEIKAIAKMHTSAVEQNGFAEAVLDFMFRNRLTDNFDGQK